MLVSLLVQQLDTRSYLPPKYRPPKTAASSRNRRFLTSLGSWLLASLCRELLQGVTQNVCCSLAPLQSYGQA